MPRCQPQAAPCRIRLKCLVGATIFGSIRPVAGQRSFFAMANWSDPRPNATAFQQADVRTGAYDAGLRRYMLSVYNYMSSAVLLSGLVAFFFAMGGDNSPAAHILI